MQRKNNFDTAAEVLTAGQKSTCVTGRTVHHLHDGEVEELLEGPQTQLAVTQQHRPALINENVLRQLLLHESTGEKFNLHQE